MKRCFMGFMLIVLIWVNAAVAQEIQQDQPVKSAAIAAIKDAYRNLDASAIEDLPIGVFDSGTGGLTVLEEILTIDAFENDSHRPSVEGDGARDFAQESFIFLADRANMPYGNYPVLDRERLLENLIVKDAWFLMGREVYDFTSLDNRPARQSKLPVKAIVIACNTATAYGQDDIEEVIQGAGLNIAVVGVINAGANGAVEALGNCRSSSIGVVPTKGTVLSNAYPAAIRRIAAAEGLTQRIDVFQQGAYGLAGAIDGAEEFILPNATTSAPRDDYRGPSLTNPEARIRREILPRYDFDFSDNHMLYSGSVENPTDLQLNSVRNYIAFHVVTLMEQIRTACDPPPLQAIILGCTHFPFYEDAFDRELDRLRNYQEDCRFIYGRHMAEKIALIDPAYFTARELYQRLAADSRLQTDEGDTG